jgi:hypothetical protein
MDSHGLSSYLVCKSLTYGTPRRGINIDLKIKIKIKIYRAETLLHSALAIGPK